MRFELLPNEIFLECYEYLNGLDIVNAFDGLNYRFQTLIENIPLNVNLEMISKTTFDLFCNKLLLNPSLKQQIYSLKLSNSSETYGQIQLFVLLFSLNQFPQLRSLSINDLDFNEFQTTRTILPMRMYLHHLSFDRGPVNIDDILMVLPSLKIQRLSIPILYNVPSIEKFRSITHLTIDQYCSLKILFEFVKSTPMLKHLQVDNFSADDNERINNATEAICLTTLILKIKCRQKFSYLEILLKQTPNLKKFILSAKDSIDIFDASRWQHIISSSLIHLRIFKFKFVIQFNRYYQTIQMQEWIVNKFEEFQNDFWHKQHYWFTLYESNNDYSIISTIPYYSDEFTLTSNTKIFSNTLINIRNLFKKVTDLKLNENSMKNHSHYYFSNIKSLTLPISIFNIKDFEWLKMHVNLFNLNSISFVENRQTISLTIILNILKKTPNLSSMSISKQMLFAFFDNSELCQYLKKMIKKLTLRKTGINPYTYEVISSNELRQVRKIFSNLEKFQCCISQLDDLLFLLSQLPKLSHLTMTTSLKLSELMDIDTFFHRLKLRLDKNFLYNYFSGQFFDKFYIWSGEK